MRTGPDIIKVGGMAERSKAAVLKTVSGVTHSGVRIPLPPPPGYCLLSLAALPAGAPVAFALTADHFVISAAYAASCSR